MLGMLGALTLSTDKQAYAVGESPVYRIEGGLPGTAIAWSSFLDGQATGEYQAYYGHTLDDTGAITIPTTGLWGNEHVGTWQKQVINIDPNNPNNPLSAQVLFTVSPTGQAPASSNGGFLSRSINILGVSLPLPLVLIGGGVGAYLLLKK